MQNLAIIIFVGWVVISILDFIEDWGNFKTDFNAPDYDIRHRKAAAAFRKACRK